MKRREKNVEQFVDRHLRLFSSPPPQEIVDAKERTFHRLRSETAGAEEPVAGFAAVRPGWRWRFVMVAAAAAVMLVVVMQAPAIRTFVWGIDGHAVVEAADGGLYRVSGGAALRAGERIEAGEAVRTNGGVGTTLKLADGSSIEMRSKSELWLERAEDGVRVRLSHGGILVNAARQRAGHLYVQTKDVTVSVVGTVFLVNAEEGGSRVAVIEGEVRVQQGATSKNLLPGEQVATNPLIPEPTVREEISWSRNAEAHVALLQQSAAAPSASPVTQPREAFDVASVRPYDPGAPTDGRGGRVWAVLGCSGDPQIDPARFAVTGATLHALIVWAYGTPNMPIEDCRGYAALNLISGGPEWIRSDQWDVQAVIPEGSPRYTQQQLRKSEAPKLQSMLRTLLEERFKIVVRREMKEAPAYALMLSTDTTSHPASKEVSSRILNGYSYTSQWLTRKPEDWQPYAPGTVGDERGRTAQSPEWNGYFKGSDASIADLVLMLGQKTGRPVLDRTGVAGTFHWFVKHSVEQPPNNSPVVGVLNPADRAHLFKALDQLGLKVEDTRYFVEVLVIERAEKPTEN